MAKKKAKKVMKVRKVKEPEEHALPSLAVVFGYIAVKELQRLEDRVAVLSRLGYGNLEIARICDISPASVATLKYMSKSKKIRRPR
jgi:DNA-binding CsgD family transcriptional regulator